MGINDQFPDTTDTAARQAEGENEPEEEGLREARERLDTDYDAS
ncbi:hypothetical protein [Streptomyces orinoci]|uniref:Uncharacterized protein n=1 Tax=Streptomyces orinoci TaxID=67339 RepID=A0ABV3K235_STRON|nr:hypothetical protein [Streptomyces orinoci]